MIFFYRYYRTYGTAKSTHARKQGTMPNDQAGFASDEKPITQPSLAAGVSDGSRSNQYTISNPAME